MIELICTNEEKIPITANPVTPGGNPVAIDGPLQVTVQSGDGTVGVIGPTSFYVVSGVILGDTTFLVKGDADLGAGIRLIQDTVLLHVIGAEASNLGLSAGMAVLK